MSRFRPGLASAPFFGLDVPGADPAALDAVACALGRRPTVIGLTSRLDSRTLPARLADLQAAGQTPLLTLEPWSATVGPGQVDLPRYTLASIAGGAHDPALTRLAWQMAQFDGPIHLRFAQEMNGWWFPWAASVNGNSPAGYVAAWRHVHTLFTRVPGLDLRWVWAPGTLGGPRATTDLASLYPGDAWVDAVGVCGYEHWSSSPADTFGPLLAQLRSLTDRPVILSEIGVDGPNKTRWLANLGGYVQRRSFVTGFVYSDTNRAAGATGDYGFSAAGDHVAAFRSSLDRIGRPRWERTADLLRMPTRGTGPTSPAAVDSRLG